MAPLEFWGLPSSSSDATLFAGGTPWDAARYGATPAAEERRKRAGGADVDLNAIAESNRGQITWLTTDDDMRAEILRRYRLFSRQPDEMITLMALQRMNPRQADFDPRLYQYGGGYIYAVGAGIGMASLSGLLDLSGAPDPYLLQPEKFARFYVVGRSLSLLAAVAALLGLAKLAARFGTPPCAWMAVLLCACTPVFITAALEAKPHMPATALLIWSAWTLCEYERTGRRRLALLGGALAGLAAACVLTGFAGLLPLLALMPFARPPQPGTLAARRLYKSDLFLGIGIALILFAVLNPYLILNVLMGNAAPSSNLLNSISMYRHQLSHVGAGLLRTFALQHEAAGWLLPAVGLVGLASIVLMKLRPASAVLAAAAGMLILSGLLAAGKPAEFARFLLLPTVAISLGAAVGLGLLWRLQPWIAGSSLLLILLTTGTIRYVCSFWTDMRGEHESRRSAAQWLVANFAESDSLAVLQEPAPYSVPPVDFHRRSVALLPRQEPASLDPDGLPDWLVFTADDGYVHAADWWQAHYSLVKQFPATSRFSRICWADKPVWIYRRQAQPPSEALPQAEG